MSLLYECINGIIQGGILEAVEGTSEGEEVARLCVGKLRGMMVIDGDANRKLSSTISTNSVYLSNFSQVCRPTCVRQNRPLASTHCITAARCDYGVY